MSQGQQIVESLFDCRKYTCALTPLSCQTRQQKASLGEVRFQGCRDCDQGKEVVKNMAYHRKGPGRPPKEESYPSSPAPMSEGVNHQVRTCSNPQCKDWDLKATKICSKCASVRANIGLKNKEVRKIILTFPKANHGLYDWIEKTADTETRNIQQQVMHILKRAMEGAPGQEQKRCTAE